MLKRELNLILKDIQTLRQENQLNLSIQDRLNASAEVYKQNLEELCEALLSRDALKSMQYVNKLLKEGK